MLPCPQGAGTGHCQPGCSQLRGSRRGAPGTKSNPGPGLAHGGPSPSTFGTGLVGDGTPPDGSPRAGVGQGRTVPPGMPDPQGGEVGSAGATCPTPVRCVSCCGRRTQGLGRAQHPRVPSWAPPTLPALPACPSGSQWGGNAGAGGEIPAEGLGRRVGGAGRAAPSPGTDTVSREHPPWDTGPLAAPSPGAWGELGCPTAAWGPRKQLCKAAATGQQRQEGDAVQGHPPTAARGMGAPTPSPSPRDWGPPAPLPSLPSLPTSPQEDTGSRPQHLSPSRAQRHQHGSQNGEWPCGSLQHRYLDGGSRHREHQGEEPTVSSQPQSSTAEGTLPSTPFPRLDTLHPGGAHGLGSPGAWGRGHRMEPGHPWTAAGRQPRAFPCRRRGRRRCGERGWHGAGSVPTTGWAKRGSQWPPAPRESSTDAAASSDPPARPAPSSDSRWEVAGERRERLRRRQQEGSGAG